MDERMRSLERAAQADPADAATAARLARLQNRAGRGADARATVRERIARGELDSETLDLVLELGASLVEGEPASLPDFNGTCKSPTRGPEEPYGEITPVVAFAGIPGAGARESVLALASLFGPRVADLREQRFDDERLIDLGVALARPWVVARRYVFRTLRVVNVPVSPHAVKLRRKLLRGTGGLAFVVDGSQDEGGLGGQSNEHAWKALATDYWRATNKRLERLPLVFQYHDAVEGAWHRWLTVALGLKRQVPRTRATVETTAPSTEPCAPRFARAQDDDRVLAHEGALESLALLLVGIASAVQRLSPPKPRCVARPFTPPGAMPRPS